MTTETHTITIEADADPETASDHAQFELTDSNGHVSTGLASANLETVFEEEVGDVAVIDTTAPLPVSDAIEYVLRQNNDSITAETNSVTLEVDVSHQSFFEVIDIDWTGRTGDQMKGGARVNLDSICSDVITHVSLVESEAPQLIAESIEVAINRKL